MRTLRIALALLLGLSVSAAAAELELTGLDGTPGALGEHVGQGQWTLVMLWASDCHVCAEEAPAIDAFHQAHKDKDARVLGIAIDGAEGRDAARGFVDRHGLHFPNAVAEFVRVAQYYRAQTGEGWIGTPTFLIFDRKGELLAKQVGRLEPELVEQFIASREGQAVQ